MNKSRSPCCTPLVVNSPLWQRAPARDENGTPYIDFMMLIPNLNNSSDSAIEMNLIKIQNCLKAFEEIVVYVDMNIRLNVLWVSLKPVSGACAEVIKAIRSEIPQAKVVASDFIPQQTQSTQNLYQRIKVLSMRLSKRMEHKLLGIDPK